MKKLGLCSALLFGLLSLAKPSEAQLKVDVRTEYNQQIENDTLAIYDRNRVRLAFEYFHQPDKPQDDTGSIALRVPIGFLDALYFASTEGSEEYKLSYSRSKGFNTHIATGGTDNNSATFASVGYRHDIFGSDANFGGAAELVSRGHTEKAGINAWLYKGPFFLGAGKYPDQNRFVISRTRKDNFAARYFIIQSDDFTLHEVIVSGASRGLLNTDSFFALQSDETIDYYSRFLGKTHPLRFREDPDERGRNFVLKFSRTGMQESVVWDFEGVKYIDGRFWLGTGLQNTSITGINTNEIRIEVGLTTDQYFGLKKGDENIRGEFRYDVDTNKWSVLLKIVRIF